MSSHYYLKYLSPELRVTASIYSLFIIKSENHYVLNNRQQPSLKISPLNAERLAIYFTLPSDELIKGAQPSVWQTKFFGSIALEQAYDRISSRIFIGGLPTYVLPPTVNMVVSISTYEELACFTLPDQIEHLFLHIPDKTAIVSTEDALNVVMRMRHFLKENPDNNILIHCKQGHSRSMMMLAVLLTVAPEEHDLPSDLTLVEACDYIRRKRSWAHVEEDKFKKAQEVIELFHRVKDALQNPVPVHSSPVSYFSSLTGKDDLRRTREFILLATFATKHKIKKPAIASAIQQFLMDILHSVDGKWFHDFSRGESPLFALAKSGSRLDRLLNNLVVRMTQLWARHDRGDAVVERACVVK